MLLEFFCWINECSDGSSASLPETLEYFKTNTFIHYNSDPAVHFLCLLFYDFYSCLTVWVAALQKNK